MNSVLAALTAEAAAPVEQVHTFMVRGTVMDVYFMDRIGVKRFHLRVNPRQDGPELIIFDGMQWARANKSSGWMNTPAQDTRSLVLSMADLFRSGLTDAVEQTAPNGGRSVKGSITWNNGALCVGKLTLLINRAGLPAALGFDGLCNEKPVQFHQAFTYTNSVTIAPPT